LLLGVRYIRNTFLRGKDSGVRYTGLNYFYSFPSLLTDPFSHFYSPRRVVLSSNAMRETPTGPSTMSSFPTKITHFSIKKTSPRCSSLLLLLREDNSKNLFYFSSLSYPPPAFRHSSLPHIVSFSSQTLLISSTQHCVILYPQSTVASRNCKSNSSQHSSKTDSATHITLSVALAHLTSAPRYRTRLHTHLCTTCILV